MFLGTLSIMRSFVCSALPFSSQIKSGIKSFVKGLIVSSLLAIPAIGISSIASPAYATPEINVRNGADTATINDGDLAAQVSVTNGTDFGSVVIGNTVVNTFIVENTGTSDLTFQNPGAAVDGGAGFFANDDNFGGMWIPAGTSRTFTVSFHPTVAGFVSSTVTLRSDDADEDPYTFVVSGTGLDQPDISVSSTASSSITDGSGESHGLVVAGTERSITYTIRNRGSQSLNLTNASATISGASNVGTPVVSNYSATTIADQDELATFTVTYTPPIAGAFGFDIDIISNDPDEATFDIPVTGTATGTSAINIQGNGQDIDYVSNSPSVSNDTDFGDVELGVKTTRTYTIQNTGTDALNITDISTDGGDFTTSNVPTSVAAQSTATFNVDLTATVAGSRSAIISVKSDDLSKANYNFNVKANSLAPEIGISSTLNNYITNNSPQIHGDYGIGIERTVTYTITNSGTSVLTLSSAAPTLSNASNIGTPTVGDYSKTSIAASGDTATFTVTYTPTAAGAFSYNLQINSNDADEGVFNIPTTGNGADLSRPFLLSVARHSPTTETTSADKLTWRITFNEDIVGLDASDIDIDGTTATVESLTAVSGSVYDLTISGGDLNTINGEVESSFGDSAVSITNIAGNFLQLSDPTGVDENTYQIVNETIPPRLVSIDRANPSDETTGEDTLTWRVIFDEDVTGVDTSDFTVAGTTATVTNVSAASATTYDVTVSGGDLANLVGTVSLSPIAGITNIQDISGNGFADATPTGTNNNSYVVFNDVVGPALVSITRQSPTSDTTDADSLTWRFTFDEDAVNFDAADVTVTGTTATASNVSTISTTVYDVTVSGGDLARLNAIVQISLSSSLTIQDTLGNNAIVTVPTTNQNFYTLVNDVAGPVLTSITRQSPRSETTDSDSLTWRFTFDEAAFDVDAADLAVTGTTAGVSNISTISSSVYDVTISGGDLASLNAVAQISLGSSLYIEDAHGNLATANVPSTNQNSYTLVNDVTAPRIASLVRHDPSTETTQEDTLIWRVTFDEAVTGVDTSDFKLSGTTASVTNVTAVSSTIYDVTVSGGDLATIAATVMIKSNGTGAKISDASGNIHSDATPIGADENSYNIELPISSTTVEVVSEEGKSVADGDADKKPDEPAGSTVTNSYTFTNTSSDPITVSGTPQITGSNNAGNPQVSNFSTPTASSLKRASLPLYQRTFDFAGTVTNDVFEAISNSIITPAYAAGEITLQPGESTSFEVTYTPESHGDFSIEVDIVSSVGTFDIDVSGSAVDTVAPSIAINGAPSSHDNSTPFNVTFEFSEDVTGFVIGDITLSNASASNFIAVDGNTYTADITPSGSSNIAIDVASSSAIDAGSNPNTAATQVVVTGGAGVSETQTAIANFMVNRANNILSNQPDMIGFINGVNNRGGGPLGNLQLESDLDSETTMSFFTSRSKILAAREGGFGKGSRPTLKDETPLFASADRFSSDDETTSNLVVKRNEDHEPEPQGFNVNDRTGSWDIWTQINGSKSTQTNLKSEFWSANFGTHYFISNDVLIGMLTQFDWAEEINSATGSTVTGNGFMVGPYVAGKVKDQNLYYEARALWGKSSNDVTPIGTYTDNFETERWLASLKVQGSYDLNDEVTIKPAVSISYFEETQEAYTDTNSNFIPEQTISLGEFKFGPSITRSFDMGNGYFIRTTAGISGIANFSVKNANTSTSNAFANEELRARVDAGIEVENEYGIRFTAAGYYDGIGASDFQSYGGSLGLIITLQ